MVTAAIRNATGVVSTQVLQEYIVTSSTSKAFGAGQQRRRMVRRRSSCCHIFRFKEREWGEDALLAADLILAEAGQVLHSNRLAHLLTDEEVEMLVTHILSLPLRTTPHSDILMASLQHSASREIDRLRCALPGVG